MTPADATTEARPGENPPGKKPRVVVVMPAYNAEKTLEATLRDIPAGSYDEVLVGDDCSKDGTVALAERLGLPVFKTPRNLGYGGNQKMLYKAALERGADIVVMLHPDYQYDPALVPHFVGFIERGVCDVILGNRVRSRREALRGGMPVWKYLFNRGLTIFLNLTYGLNLVPLRLPRLPARGAREGRDRRQHRRLRVRCAVPRAGDLARLHDRGRADAGEVLQGGVVDRLLAVGALRDRQPQGGDAVHAAAARHPLRALRAAARRLSARSGAPDFTAADRRGGRADNGRWRGAGRG
jgi:hypothetical protein